MGARLARTRGRGMAWQEVSEGLEREPPANLANGRRVPLLASAHNADRVDVPAVRNLQPSRLPEETLLPWPGVVVTVGELRGGREVDRGDALGPASRQ